MAFTKLSKRDKEWLSSIGFSIRLVAATLEGEKCVIYKAEDAPVVLRKIAAALERAGAGKV